MTFSYYKPQSIHISRVQQTAEAKSALSRESPRMQFSAPVEPGLIATDFTPTIPNITVRTDNKVPKGMCAPDNIITEPSTINVTNPSINAMPNDTAAVPVTETQKLSMFKPMGSPPHNYRISQSCDTCEYNISDYGSGGYCKLYDFAIQGHYLCDSYEVCRLSSPELLAAPIETTDTQSLTTTVPDTSVVMLDNQTTLLQKFCSHFVTWREGLNEAELVNSIKLSLQKHKDYDLEQVGVWDDFLVEEISKQAYQRYSAIPTALTYDWALRQYEQNKEQSNG